MAYKIQIKSCLKVDLPTLDVGEFALCTDSNELFIGSEQGNIQISNIEMIGILTNLTTQNKTNITAAINEINKNLTDLAELEINIEESNVNGNLNVNGTELVVYDESSIIDQLSTKAKTIDLESKANINHQHNLTDINEISISDLQEGHTLQYDSSISKFSAKPLSFNNIELNQLKDIRYPTNSPSNGNILTYNQGFWEPTEIEPLNGKKSGSYLIELDRWGIKNDKTNPNETVDGINNAFLWASENGYRHIVLPKGEYLISHTKSLFPQNNTHYDFGGSRIYMEPNNKEGYSIVSIGSPDSTKKAHHITITNGEFIGDRYEHDFSSGGTHEWGHCISLKGHCKFIKISNCILRDAIGDGYIGEGNYEVWLYPNQSNFEIGTISKTSGVKENSVNKVRTISPYDVSHFRVTNNDNKFMLTGNGYGTLRGINTDIFDIFFYDGVGNFIEHKENIAWYENIERPQGAIKMHIVLHQETFDNVAFEVRAEPRPEFITIENCEVMNNRRVGIVGAGTRNFYIKNNSIHHNTGYVGAGIDIEDGYRTNQNIYIDGNKFYGHGINDVILVGTYYVSVTNNSFQANCGGSGKYWVISNNRFSKGGGSLLASDLIFSHNVCHDARLSFGNSNSNKIKSIIISCCTFNNSSIILNHSQPYSINLSSCYFFNDNNKYREGSISSFNYPCLINDITVVGGEKNGATITATEDSLILNSTFTNSVFSGSYFMNFKNCIISNPLTMTTNVSNKDKILIFEECDLTIKERFITFNSPNSSLKLLNSKIKHTGSTLDFISITAADSIEVVNCKFIAPNASTGSFFTSSGFNKAYCLFDRNHFESTSTNVKTINFDWKLTVEPSVFLENSYLNIAMPIQKLGDTHRFGTSQFRPQKKLKIGFEYFDTTLSRPIFIKQAGSGFYTSEKSQRNKSYKLGHLILENGNIHECVLEGTTDSILPEFTTKLGNTTSDGGVVWICKGFPAVWGDSNGNNV